MIFLSCAVCFAEVSGGQKKYGFSFLGGFAFSGHKSNGAGSVQSSTGLSFGIGLDYKVMPSIAIEVDLLDVWKNYEVHGAASVTKNSLSYLEIPILIKYIASPNFSLKAGPYLAAFIMSADREVGRTSSAVKGDFANDFGMTFGAWAGFYPNQGFSIGLDLQYDLGLNNILGDSDPSHSINSRTFISMLAMTFYFK